MSYLIISTIVLLVAAVAIMNGIGLRRQGKADEGTAWILGAALALVVVIGGWGAFRSFHSVNAGHVLVVRQFGEIVGQREAGFQTIAPWQSAEEVSTQVESQKFQMDDRPTPTIELGIRSGPAVSEETQPVYAVVTLNYRVSDQAIQELYTEVGAGFFEKVVAPRVFQVFKNETVKFKSVSVAPNREQIRQEVQEELDNQLNQFSIDVVDFLINDLEFPQEFTEAIERKQVATQDALAARQKVEQSKAEAQQEIERARGQAQAQRLRASSLTDRNLQFEALQILKEAPPQIVFLPAGQGNLLDPSTFLRSATTQP
ncbi:MAG: prohibitin family protein [Actinobacteria bacterium]|nr:prohibitin family protein [Actinomycetota bacterium]